MIMFQEEYEVLLDDLGITIDNYNKMLAEGYITERKHPDNPKICIANYTLKASFERLWNEATLNCRGLIFDKVTRRIISLPFAKFFNLGEYKGEIPDEQPEITVKYDGSLGISYRLDNKIFWATRGSFESEQAKIAQEIWNEKYWNKNIPADITLLVEIIHPLTKVVVNYNFVDLILIGARDSNNGYDFSYEELCELARDMEMPVTEKVEANIDEIVKKCVTLDSQEEGFVLRWSDGFRIKVKSAEYQKVHKIVCGLSDKAIAEAWKDEKIADLITKLPEEFRIEIEDKTSQLNSVLRLEIEKVRKIYEEIKDKNRKEFALYVMANCPEYSKHLFLMLDNKLKVEHFRQTIARDYAKYLEGSKKENCEI